jgi:hypothetical protein
MSRRLALPAVTRSVLRLSDMLHMYACCDSWKSPALAVEREWLLTRSWLRGVSADAGSLNADAGS